MHGFARNNARRFDVHLLTLSFNTNEGALAVDGLTQGVEHAAQQAFANRNRHNLTQALNGVAFLDRAVFAENHDADIVALKVEGHTLNAAWKLNHFARLDAVEAIDAGDPVTNGQHSTDISNSCFSTKVFNLILQDRGNFCGADVHASGPLHRNFKCVEFRFDRIVE